MNILRSYQSTAITEIAQKLAVGKKAVILQLATGGGKTVMLSTIAQRYNAKSQKRVLILVHREELLYQTRRTLFDWYQINCEFVMQDTKRVQPTAVYVGMCETVFRRLSRNRSYLPDFGLVIYDECHRGEFKKLMKFFPDSFTIGFTATPLSATKKDPLKNYYQDIVCGVDIPELIAEGSLAQNHTYSIKGIQRSKLKIRNGEFDEHEMAEAFSKVKHLQNTVDAYRKHADNSKAIIFNCNIEHSMKVTEAFVIAGYPCRHIDGGTPNDQRKAAFKWLKETDNAILCNVGIATTGLDEPTVRTIIMNRATLSPTLWLQCTGRGARPLADKDYFTIIDMGGNALEHGDWCDSRDWSAIFHNPPKPREKLGVAPVKDCPACEALIPVQSMTCKYCGYIFPVREQQYDKLPVELELITKNLNVAEMVERNAMHKPYYTLFQIGNNLATQAKYKLSVLSEPVASQILNVYQEKAKEWCKLNNKKWNRFHQELTRKHLSEQLMRKFASFYKTG